MLLVPEVRRSDGLGQWRFWQHIGATAHSILWINQTPRVIAQYTAFMLSHILHCQNTQAAVWLLNGAKRIPAQ